MDSVSRYGIKARYDGSCGLCGCQVQVGDRLFQLPPKRTGAQGRWVCTACRWPDVDRVIDVPFVIRKAEHRLRIVAPYTPSLVELQTIMDGVGGVSDETADEIALLAALRLGLEQRRPPTLGRVKTSVLLGLLHRSQGFVHSSVR